MTQFSCYPLAKMRSICCVRPLSVPLSVFEMRQQASKLANAGEAGDLLAIRAPCLPSLRVPGLLRLGRFKLIMAAAALQQDSLDLCCELSPYPAGDMAIHSLEGAPSSRVTTVTLGFLTRVGARCFAAPHGIESLAGSRTMAYPVLIPRSLHGSKSLVFSKKTFVTGEPHCGESQQTLERYC